MWTKKVSAEFLSQPSAELVIIRGRQRKPLLFPSLPPPPSPLPTPSSREKKRAVKKKNTRLTTDIFQAYFS